jgi:DNA-binding beta-propeller fold protein YncE
VVTTIAGLATYPGNADGTNSAARFYSPGGIAVDVAGNVYVADSRTPDIDPARNVRFFL